MGACEIFNAGYENESTKELMEIVKSLAGEDVKLVTIPTGDKPSFHTSSKKIREEPGFETKRAIREVIEDLCNAFNKTLLPDSLGHKMYFNIKRMQNLRLI